MARTKVRAEGDKHLSYRLSGALAERWWVVYDRAQQRAIANRVKIDDSKVARALMGIKEEGLEWLLTEEDLQYFQGVPPKNTKTTPDTTRVRKRQDKSETEQLRQSK